MFIYLWLPWVFVAECRLSLVAVKGRCSLVLVHRLLIAVASFVAEHGLWGPWPSEVAPAELSSCDTQALEHRLRNCGAQA